VLGKWKKYLGLKKVPSGCSGQEDFPAGQVTFHSHLPAGQVIRQAVSLPTKSLKEETMTSPGQAEFESYLSQSWNSIFFFEP